MNIMSEPKYKLLFIIDNTEYQIETVGVDDNTVSADDAEHFMEQMKNTINFTVTAVGGDMYTVTKPKMKHCHFKAEKVK